MPGVGNRDHVRCTPGAYVILFHLPALYEVQVGRLGRFDIPAGTFAYVGSARRGVEARTGRHLRGSDRKQWHIDYLMDLATQKEALTFPSNQDIECALADWIRMREGTEEPVRGFGSSDCSCSAHLFMVTETTVHDLRSLSSRHAHGMDGGGIFGNLSPMLRQ
jgi:Uri superfamily endonuclease